MAKNKVEMLKAQLEKAELDIKAKLEKEVKKKVPELPEFPDKDMGANLKPIKKLSKLKFRDKWRLRRKPEKSFLVTMLFSNGTSKTFVVATREEVFTYKKRTYYLKYDDSWFSLSHNQYRLFYFDDSPVPLQREIIKRGEKPFWSVSPDNLKPLLKMEYVKTLAQSQELSRFLKFSLLLGVANAFLSVIILGLIYNGLYSG